MRGEKIRDKEAHKTERKRLGRSGREAAVSGR